MKRGHTKILLVGRYPPPYGGITVHIERLQHTLMADCEVTVFDPYPDSGGERLRGVYGGFGSWGSALATYVRLLTTRHFDIVHFHTSAMGRFTSAGLAMLLCARLLRARCVITIHGGDFVQHSRRAGDGCRAAVRRVLTLCHHLVAVNEVQRRFLLDDCAIPASRVTVIPAFLPPSVASASHYDSCLAQWREQRRLILCSSGYGLPYYGFHTLIDALLELNTEPRQKRAYALLVCIYQHRDESYLRGLLLAAGNLPLIVAHDLEPAEFARLLRHSDRYLRCSERDGDAVAVREALYLGTPVIASDCVARPDGVVTYASGDPRALARAIAAPVTAVSEGIRTAGDHATALRTVYQRLLS